MPRRSWSYSRDNLLQACERKLYFYYYAGARINSRDPLKREVARLKKLKNISMWVGDIVHTVIAEYFKLLAAGNPMPLEATKRRGIEIADKQWNFSLERRYIEINESSAGESYAALFEHEYNKPLPGEAKAEAIHGIVLCLENFYELQKKLGIASAFRQALDYWIDPRPYGPEATTFELEEVRIIVKVDLAFIDAQSHCQIFDWKTGKSGNDSFIDQMETYILWPHLSFDAQLNQITAYAINLQTKEATPFELDQESKWIRLVSIKRSIQRIDALLLDPSKRIADIRDFDYARHVKICEWCRFQRVCKEWEYASLHLI